MGAAHADSPPITPFISLCGLATFATNCDFPVRIHQLSSPQAVSVLADLISSAEVPRLALPDGFPYDALPELSASIKRTVVSLSVGKAIRRRFHESMPQLEHLVLQAVGPMLEQLTISGMELDVNLGPALSGCTALREIAVRGCGFSPGACNALMKVIGCAKSIEDICFASGRVVGMAWMNICSSYVKRETCLEDSGVCSLVAGLLSSKKCRIQRLSLPLSQMGRDGFAQLVRLVRAAPQLRALDISGNPVGDEQAAELGDAIRERRSLAELDVSDGPLGDVCRKYKVRHCDSDRSIFTRGTILLLSPLHGAVALRYLRLDWSSLYTPGAIAIANYIMSFPNAGFVIQLSLRSSRIDSEGAIALSKALRTANNMTTLALSDNPKIGPAGSVAILDALASPPVIHPMEELDLVCCHMQNEGAFAIARFLKSRGCTRLKLDNNSIDSEGIQAISDAIRSNAGTAKTTMLSLDGNYAGEVGTRFLIQNVIMQPNTTVVELNLGMTRLGVGGARAIVQAIMVRGKGRGALRKVRVALRNYGMAEQEELRMAQEDSGETVLEIEIPPNCDCYQSNECV